MKKVTTIFALFLMSCGESKNYLVEITYCDDRPKKQIIVNRRNRPSNFSIYTYKVAVPEFEGELNVCDVKVLKELN